MKLNCITNKIPLTLCSVAVFTLAACGSDNTSQIEEDLANSGTSTINVSTDDDNASVADDTEAPVEETPIAADDPVAIDGPVVTDPAILPSCTSALSDSDGDGFGFENNQSCVVDATTQPAPVNQPEPAPSDDPPVAEVPDVEDPVAEEPVAEDPVIDDPIAEVPVVDEPVADVPVVDEPVVVPPPVISTAFGTIQSTVFTPICSECHGPVGASAGLRLDATVSFSTIVGVASTEVPALSRIEPGDPDNSYLIQKIEGTQAIGAQMPLGGPPLPAETMAFFREWVSNGALPDGATIDTAASAFAPAVASASIDQDAVLDRMPETLSIVWTSPVDNSSLSDATVSLVRSGGDGTFNDGNEVAVDVYTAETTNPYITTLVTTELKPTEDSFQLRILGDGDTVARSVDALTIDGNGNGAAGGNFIRNFVIENP